MASIKSKDTRPEMIVRRGLHSIGFRYKLHDRNLPGRPDIVLPRYGVAIFVHGCFWHGHQCKQPYPPRSNTEFWIEKIRKNKARDKSNIAKLHRLGWRVIVLRECELATIQKRSESLERLSKAIRSNRN